MVEDWTDAVAKALERLDVADTLGELRHHIDALIERLSDSQSPDAANPTPLVAQDEALDGQIESLGKKVEFASDMLAQLTDLLESQNERIETIEQQIGDPEAGIPPASRAETSQDGAVTRIGTAAVDTLQREVAALRAERERLEERMVRLESLTCRLESTVETVRDMAFQREERVRELEERLQTFVEKTSPPRVAAAFASGAAGDWREPVDAAMARRIEDLVEREIRLQREFSQGSVGERGLRPGRATIMVVDDSADARTILSMYLSRTGYQVVSAASAEDCLAKLRHHRVDAVVLDATMPGGGAEHVLGVLTNDHTFAEHKPRPAVIVYTAHPDALSREKAKQLGASDYVVKGGDLLPLLTTLVRHLHPSEHTAI